MLCYHQRNEDAARRLLGAATIDVCYVRWVPDGKDSMSFHIAIRLIGMALFAAAGFFLGLYLSPIIYGERPTRITTLSFISP